MPIQKIIKNFKAHLTLFFIGFILGPACDLFHNVTLTSGYLHPQFLGLAFWVPLLFGSATLLIGLSHTLTPLLFKQKIVLKKDVPLYIPLILFAFQYALSGYVFAPLASKFLILLFVTALNIWILKSSAFDLVLAIITGISGCAVEVLLGISGHFFYFEMHRQFSGIPYWLPLLYMTASLAVGELGRRLYLKKSS